MQNSKFNQIIAWGILIVILAAAALVLFTFRAEIAASFGMAAPCGQPQLEINGQSYPIKTIKPNKTGIAYWVADTTSNYVFYISAETLALDGGAAKITWANCNATTYVLYEPEQGVPDNATLLDQSTSGITLVIQNAMVIKGSLIGEELNVIPTPDPAEMLAEISLLETTTSADKITLSVSVSIANYGQSAITVTLNDVALLVDNASNALLTSEPPLPKEIAAGATETFIFTFARPDAPTATIKVFGAEYELEGY